MVPVDNVGEVLDRALVGSTAESRPRRTAGFMLPLRNDEGPHPTITA